ncbi:hypothetical protein EW026_g2575 [Hermanssonia centrifuga]|uniref:Uncharacterized protein n=1 Tax=Hermanssonia centrifuga TaxID=98765 RepID=A0A4S4KPT4_9APHY|nr:hypothetical protein EW026_g2575 [Hermanssonia centrifuga]
MPPEPESNHEIEPVESASTTPLQEDKDDTPSFDIAPSTPSPILQNGEDPMSLSSLEESTSRSDSGSVSTEREQIPPADQTVSILQLETISPPEEQKSSPASAEFLPSASPHCSEPSDSTVASSSTAPSSARTSLTDSHSQSCGQRPTGILRCLTAPNSSPVSVTFAPLPQLDPRRRTSTVQLGIAARSRMLRARRMQMGQLEPLPSTPDTPHVQGSPANLSLEQMRELEELNAQIRAHAHTKKPMTAYGNNVPLWKSATAGFATPEEEAMPEEDALLALGQMIKGGARTLWRRVSHSQLKERSKHSQGKEERPALRRSASEPTVLESEEGLTVRVLVKEPRHLFEEQEDDKEGEEERMQDVKVTEHVRGSVEGEEQGRVWEEEISEDVRLRMQAAVKANEKEKEKKSGLGVKLGFGSVRGNKTKSR